MKMFIIKKANHDSSLSLLCSIHLNVNTMISLPHHYTMRTQLKLTIYNLESKEATIKDG